jgi:hypothetical protein
MKLTTTELEQLFRKATGSHTAGAAPAMQGDLSLTKTNLSVELVRACCRTLWQRIDQRTLSKKEARQRMLELIEWLSKKQHWNFQSNVLQEYRHLDKKIDGRVHGAITGQGRTVVVELCFDLQDAVIFKLWAAFTQNKQVLLLWGGPPMPDTAFAGKLSAAFRGRPVKWIRFLQLTKPD